MGKPMKEPSRTSEIDATNSVPFDRRVAVLSAFITAVSVFVIGLLTGARYFEQTFWGLVILASLAIGPSFLLGRSLGQLFSSIGTARSRIELLRQQLQKLEAAYLATRGAPLSPAEVEARLRVMLRDEDIVKHYKALRHYEPLSRLSTAWQHWVIHDRYLGAAAGALIAFIPLASDRGVVRDITSAYGAGDAWGRLFLVVGVAALVGALLHQLVRWTLRAHPGHASGQGIAAKPPGIDKKAS
jgi:hypothetical protein